MVSNGCETWGKHFLTAYILDLKVKQMGQKVSNDWDSNFVINDVFL